jgi:hypothetical protein
MLPPDRAQTFQTIPMVDLIAVLLRQMKRPLANDAGLTLSDALADDMAQARVAGRAGPLAAAELSAALIRVVTASEGVLAWWGLTFQQSLDTLMERIPGWTTTAEFLELANEKSNAELRITLGAALALILADERRYLPYLLHLAGGDYGDETMIARRALLFVTGVAADAPDWLSQVKTRLGR